MSKISNDHETESQQPIQSGDVEAESQNSGWQGALEECIYRCRGTIDVLQAWYWTRSWRQICLRGIGVMLILGSIPLLLIASTLVRRHQLVAFYSQFLDSRPAPGVAKVKPHSEDQEGQETDSSATFTIEPVSAIGKLSARRLLQLNDTHEAAHFLIATDLARAGKVDQARQMMSKVAPADGRGFAPGHAWLAASYLTSGTFDPKDPAARQRIVHHLEQGMRWEGADPRLRTFFAALLEREGRYDRAAEVLSKAVMQDPALVTSLADMVRRYKLGAGFRDVIDTAKKTLESRLEVAKSSIHDQITLAMLALVEDDPNAALRRIDAAAKIDPKDSRLPRLRSEAIRKEYRGTITKKQDGVVVSLELLDAALKADPTNPAIDSEITLLLAQGIGVSEKVHEFLRDKLASGRATALTHLILAIQKVKSGEVAEAIPHLEIGLKLAPGSALILNNLAYALAITQPDQLPRALELISKAVETSSRNPNFLETQGEIFLIADQPLDAIASLEEALTVDADRITTRKLLLTAYEQANLHDLAETQRRQLEQMGKQPTAIDPGATPSDHVPTAP